MESYLIPAAIVFMIALFIIGMVMEYIDHRREKYWGVSNTPKSDSTLTNMILLSMLFDDHDDDLF